LYIGQLKRQSTNYKYLHLLIEMFHRLVLIYAKEISASGRHCFWERLAVFRHTLSRHTTTSHQNTRRFPNTSSPTQD